MPSRPVVVGIVLFWVAVLAAVANRELVPRFFGGTPPTPEFVLVDELSQATVNWTIYRGPAGGTADEKIGTMTSRTEYVPADDSFRFVNSYRGVQLRSSVVELTIPTATSTLRVTRDGRLLEQTARGVAEIDLGRLAPDPTKKLTATAEVKGVVRDGFLEGTATLSVPELLAEPVVSTLEPVPVPQGQILNPLMPTDRLRDVVPGRRWAVRQVDPLRDAIAELISKAIQEAMAGAGEGKKRAATPVKLPPAPELLAEVLREPETLQRAGGPVNCWVIEYKSADPPVSARTWVRRDDGRVLRQEATAYGERMRFERDE